MLRANYSYQIKDIQGRNIISIIDLYNASYPTKSVTNDIENVITDIERKESLDANNYIVVYRDTDGNWDGWDTRAKEFVSGNSTDENEAIRNLIKKQLD